MPEYFYKGNKTLCFIYINNYNFYSIIVSTKLVNVTRSATTTTTTATATIFFLKYDDDDHDKLSTTTKLFVCHSNRV